MNRHGGPQNMNVRLGKEQKIQVTTAEDIYLIMRQILLRENRMGQNKEHFWVVGLASDQRILFIELASLGSVKEAIVNPSEIFQFAIQKLAVKIILVHNHPSGNLNPSAADEDITDRLIQAGKLVEKDVLDHLIISPEGYFSFEKEGVMDRLRKSMKHRLPFVDEGWIKRDIVRKMLKQGVSVDTISIVSGLTEEQINTLQYKESVHVFYVSE